MAAVKQTVEHVESLEKYKHGFVTDIDQEFAPKGLSADIVRFISAKKDEPEWMLQWRLDDNYEASLFFLPGVWDYQQQELGGAPAAIFAARNLVFFANSADPEAMAILDILATTEGDAPAYAIAPGQIWLWQDRGWVPYEKPVELPPVLH